MIGRTIMLAIAVIAAGCSKPRDARRPRPGEAKQAEGGWSIVEVEPAASADASAEDRAKPAEGGAAEGEATETDARTAAADANAEAGAPAGGEAGRSDDEPREPALSSRTPIVPPEHPQYGRLEGEGLANACKRDGECTMSGCAREVCSAQQGVTTTCDVLPVALPTDAACGCVAGECVWYSRTGATLPLPKRDGPEPNRGEAPRKGPIVCGKVTCKPGQQCIEYFGIAGPSGPRFESCEWPCNKGQRCPKGTTCTTIADGPGRVCR